MSDPNRVPNPHWLPPAGTKERKEWKFERDPQVRRFKIDQFAPAQVPANTVVQKFDTDTIQVRFERFHYGHPEVYEGLVRTARALRSEGIEKIGIAEMWEGMRNSKRLNWSEEEYKLCNDYRSRYARLIHEQEDDLRGFFRTRQLTSK